MSEKSKMIVKRKGSERAAILLMSLGEQEAAAVLKHMGAKDVQRVGGAMAQMQNVSKEEVESVLQTFNQSVEGQTSLGVGADEYIKKVLINALGADKAAGIIDRILLGHSSKGLETLKWMDPRQISDMIRLEHPQIISIVLAYLDPDLSAEVLGQLPEWLRSDVVLRIAALDGVQPSALNELDEIMERQLSGNNGGNGKRSTMGGAKAAANILNFMEPSKEAPLMEHIRKVDEQLGDKIQDLMFVFDNLLEVDDRGMQELLRAVQSDQLLLAMKGADDALKEKIFKNMSQRAAEMLKDDLESRGPVRLSEVEAAQKEVLTTARKLADAGTLQLGGKGGEEYV